jgi:hypothetical protein
VVSNRAHPGEGQRERADGGSTNGVEQSASRGEVHGIEVEEGPHSAAELGVSRVGATVSGVGATGAWYRRYPYATSEGAKWFPRTDREGFEPSVRF